jgi:Domain of unknown function (DUF4214)
MQNINQLLRLNDTTFITGVYKALLGRSPDPEGMQYYLGRLRAGYSKRSLIVQIADSKEARALAISLPGLNELRLSQKKSSHWFWGMFSRNQRIERQTYLLENELAHLAEQCQRLEQAVYQQSMTLTLLAKESKTPNLCSTSSSTPASLLMPTQVESPQARNTAELRLQQNFSKPVEWPPTRSISKTPLEEYGHIFSQASK